MTQSFLQSEDARMEQVLRKHDDCTPKGCVKLCQEVITEQHASHARYNEHLRGEISQLKELDFWGVPGEETPDVENFREAVLALLSPNE